MLKEICMVDIDAISVRESIERMIYEAMMGNFIAKQELNGVLVLVDGNSQPELIYRDQQRAQRGFMEGIVGPFPPERLSSESIACDQLIEAENRLRSVKAKAIAQDIIAGMQGKLLAELDSCPPMERINCESNEALAALTDSPYGQYCYAYAEKWARFMQKSMSQGVTLASIADDCQQKTECLCGSTGFMLGYVVCILVDCWMYGENCVNGITY